MEQGYTTPWRRLGGKPCGCGRETFHCFRGFRLCEVSIKSPRSGVAKTASGGPSAVIKSVIYKEVPPSVPVAHRGCFEGPACYHWSSSLLQLSMRVMTLWNSGDLSEDGEALPGNMTSARHANENLRSEFLLLASNRLLPSPSPDLRAADASSCLASFMGGSIELPSSVWPPDRQRTAHSRTAVMQDFGDAILFPSSGSSPTPQRYESLHRPGCVRPAAVESLNGVRV